MTAPSVSTETERRAGKRRSSLRLLLLCCLLLGLFGVGLFVEGQDLRSWWLSRQSLEALRSQAEAPHSDALPRYLYAEKLLQANRLPESLAAFQAADQALPVNAHTPLAEKIAAHLGYLLTRAGRAAEADPYLERARKLDETDSLVYQGFGAIFFQRKAYDYAETQYKMVVQLDPKNAEGWYRLGEIYDETAKPQQALDPLLHAVKLAPESPAIHLELGNCYALQARFAEALPEFRTARRLAPDDLNIQSAYGAAAAMNAHSREEYQEAVGLLETVLRARPNDENLAFTLGLLHLRFNAYPEALRNFQRVIAMDPNRVDVWYNVSVIEQRMGDTAASQKARARSQELRALHDGALVLEKRILAGPTDPALRVQLARLYAKQNNLVGALGQYKVALQLKPDQPQVATEFNELQQRYSRLRLQGLPPSALGAPGPPGPPDAPQK
ncbi:MAG TPA: tetratricopeptide repeat protein [Chthonomonadaceae bacterium]|nr:tetratricopeptide repeat protein [Chthonomonadaceae bacterium]